MHPVITTWHTAWRHDELLREAAVARLVRRARRTGHATAAGGTTGGRR